MQEKKRALCPEHKAKIIQLGQCSTCGSYAPICDTKGCIKSHSDNERVHTVRTVESIKHIVHEFDSSNKTKKAYLKKMVSEYFNEARKQMDLIFTQIYQLIENFKFDGVILHEDEQKIKDQLLKEEYQNLTCADIANIIPKLEKGTHFEDGHFIHIRNYLRYEKEKLPSILNSVILNLPYFRQLPLIQVPTSNCRDYDRETAINQFYLIEDEHLKQINKKLSQLRVRPKYLRLKYLDVVLNKLRTILKNRGQISLVRQKQFVKIFGTMDSLCDLEAIEFYCTWELEANEFYMAIMEVISQLPYLKSLTIFTIGKISNYDFMEEIFEKKNIQIQIYKKQWKV